jgi:hypothetical protein
MPPRSSIGAPAARTARPQSTVQTVVNAALAPENRPVVTALGMFVVSLSISLSRCTATGKAWDDGKEPGYDVLRWGWESAGSLCDGRRICEGIEVRMGRGYVILDGAWYSEVGEKEET